VSARRPLLPILLVFVALGVVYSLATPVLEASDEFDHYPYVQYVQTQHALPVMDPLDPEPWRQEAGQPPLYYLLMAGLTSWIDTSDLLEIRRLNHHAFVGIPGQVGNKNLVIHRPERESFPWSGTVLAVHVIRLVSVALGAVTVWLVWLVARQLCPDSRWAPALAAALTALNPMFLFIGGAVNNDVLAALLGSLALLLLVKEYAAPPRPLASLRLGLVLGLGALTKVSLVAMVPLALLVIIVRSWRQRAEMPFRRAASIIVHCSLFIVIILGVAGWWYVRNWRLYGDPTGLNAFIEILGRRAEPLTWRGFVGEFGTFRRTYWGLFGGVNVPAPEPVYVFYDVLTLAGLAGLALRGWRKRRAGVGTWWVPAAWIAILLASLMNWVLIYYSFQGRLIFPGIAACSLFLALGLGEWLPARLRPAGALVVGGVLFLLAAALPFVTIRPAYAYPASLTLDEVPAGARVEPVDVGGVARLVGWELAPQVAEPGGGVEVVVYWEAAAPDGRDLLGFAKLLGRGGHELVGQVTRHPAGGAVPTGSWEAGQVWRDLYWVEVAENASAPSRLRVVVGLYDPEAETDLGAVTVGEARLPPPPSLPAPAYPLAVDLADGIALRGYDLPAEVAAPGETITLTLHWEATGTPTADYQVFVHLLGEGPEAAAQGDGPPLWGDYVTGIWAAGEEIVDPHAIALPADLVPGSYRLVVGMYSLETLVRLVRWDGGGDAVEIPAAVQVR
jgi:4-amino-4-deoxy-L-arabinose transferase-like glycosyltransferase